MPGADTALAQGLDVQTLLGDDRRVRPAEANPNPFNCRPLVVATSITGKACNSRPDRTHYPGLGDARTAAGSQFVSR
jgi:hypothetical protein